MKPYVIAIATDANLFGPATFLANKLANLNPRDDVEIVIFSTAARDVALARDNGVWENFHSLSLPPDMPKSRWPAASYIRVLVPRRVGPDVRRILYLDVDTFPESDALFHLFDLDMRGHVIAGVRQRRSALQYVSANLMNSGVLLIDRARYLAMNLEQRILSIGRQIGQDDQHAINRALMGNWLELSPAMNMLRAFRFSFVPEVIAPSITHFVDSPKPWDGARFSDPHPARAEIEKYLTQPYKTDGDVEDEPTPPLTAEDIGRTKLYLRREFADVAQGITSIRS